MSDIAADWRWRKSVLVQQCRVGITRFATGWFARRRRPPAKLDQVLHAQMQSSRLDEVDHGVASLVPALDVPVGLDNVLEGEAATYHRPQVPLRCEARELARVVLRRPGDDDPLATCEGNPGDGEDFRQPGNDEEEAPCVL